MIFQLFVYLIYSIYHLYNTYILFITYNVHIYVCIYRKQYLLVSGVAIIRDIFIF